MFWGKKDVSFQIKAILNGFTGIHIQHLEEHTFFSSTGYNIHLNQCKESTSNKIFPKCNALILKINFKR